MPSLLDVYHIVQGKCKVIKAAKFQTSKALGMFKHKLIESFCQSSEGVLCDGDLKVLLINSPPEFVNIS